MTTFSINKSNQSLNSICFRMSNSNMTMMKLKICINKIEYERYIKKSIGKRLLNLSNDLSEVPYFLKTDTMCFTCVSIKPNTSDNLFKEAEIPKGTFSKQLSLVVNIQRILIYKFKAALSKSILKHCTKIISEITLAIYNYIATLFAINNFKIIS